MIQYVLEVWDGDGTLLDYYLLKQRPSQPALLNMLDSYIRIDGMEAKELITLDQIDDGTALTNNGAYIFRLHQMQYHDFMSGDLIGANKI